VAAAELSEDVCWDAARLAALRLCLVSGVGPRLRRLLIGRFGSAEAVLAAAPSDLRRVPGIGPKLTEAIARGAREIEVAGELERCRQHGVQILLDKDAGYPRLLSQLDDPPGVIFQRGEYLPADELAIAIVGSRHATQYGLAQAERLAASLSRAGLTIVSGLARGIDGAAHRGAMGAGGRTIGVLGSGLASIYPPEHVGLADEVAEHGALLSELPCTYQPLAGTFPQRNRLISGLSLGVIVVEAAQRSGALITARHAMEQGHDVFAVPGRVDSPVSKGCHQLLRDGAKLVECAEDVLEELGPLAAPAQHGEGRIVHHPGELLLNEIEQQVLDAIRSEPTLVDQVIATTGLPVSRVLATLSALEIRHLVRRVSGTLVRRN